MLMSTKTRRFEPDDNTIDVIATEHNADRGSVREAYRRAATLANQGHDREEITAELQQSMNLQGAVITVVVAGATAYAGINVMNSIAETVFPLGDEAGAGSAMKAVNQMLAGVHIAAMAEAITFGMTQGVSPTSFIDVISKCAGTSWMLENRAPHIADGDYTPRSSVNIWPKDLGIVLDIADQADFDAPITKTALAQYAKAVEAGLGLEDDAAVAKVYAAQAGLSLPKGTPS